jgi:hypothetical protein
MKIPRHPFAVCGRIAQCWLFVHRVPVEDVRVLLPAPLELVTHGGFAFWNVVVCRLTNMRPFPLPAAFGIGYWHVAYRLHARLAGKIEGLYFVGSECDRTLVTWSGNLLTDFRFRTARIRVEASERSVDGSVGAARFRIDRTSTPAFADGSPFATLDEAAQALEYPPRALCPTDDGSVSVVQVRRDPAAWRWRNVAATEARWVLPGLAEAPLELCYEIEPIDYRWERAQRVKGRPCAS